MPTSRSMTSALPRSRSRISAAAGQVSGTTTTRGLSWSYTIRKTMNSALSSTTTALREQPGERAQADVDVGVGRKKHGVAGAPVVQDGQLLPGPCRISHDGETVDPAVGQRGCQGSRRSGLLAKVAQFRGEIKHGDM